MKRLVIMVAVIAAAVALYLMYSARPIDHTRSSAPPDTIRHVAIDSTDHALQASLEAIAAVAPGRLAIAAKNLRTGKVASVNASARVPLMSVMKLPIALMVLEGVDQGRWALDTAVPVRRQDMNPGVSVLTERFPLGGASVDVHELTNLALTVSDNTAADVLLRMVGGPAAVTAWLQEHGVNDVRLDRSELELGNDWYGLTNPPPESTWSAPKLRALREWIPQAKRDSAALALGRDPRDTATPEALVLMLERLWRGKMLSPAMTHTIQGMLVHCETGMGRLPGELPPGTPVARKTGTAGTRHGATAAINDVGVIRLPNGDDVAIAAMVADVRGPVSGAESTIALAARTVYDAWSAKDSARADARP